MSTSHHNIGVLKARDISVRM